VSFEHLSYEDRDLDFFQQDGPYSVQFNGCHTERFVGPDT